MEKEKVINSLGRCSCNVPDACRDCDYDNYPARVCVQHLTADALVLLEEWETERKDIVHWLAKFCRHIDNKDRWLSDDESLEFFKKKMKQQFGWDTDGIELD